MNLNIFIYIILNLLFLQLVGLEENWSIRSLEIMSIIGIATFGVAHGAIDHVLYQSKTVTPGAGHAQFIIQYLIVAALFALLWFVAPVIALMLFLIISAYHFGQSQYTGLVSLSKGLKGMLYFSWGGLVLSFMFLFKPNDFNSISGLDQDLESALIWAVENAQTFTLTFFISFLSLFIYLIAQRKINHQQAGMEVFLLGLIVCSFYLLPAFIAFSLFFVVVHSSKVIAQEYDYCKKEKIIQSKSSFLRLFLPLTLVSLAGIVLTYFTARQLSKLPDLWVFALLVLVSSVTLPHAFVMERFYKN